MPASALVRLPDGSVETLYVGDIVGRTWSAAVRIDDPDVSEAHALVSLRGERLWLLALRRRFTVSGKVVEAVPWSKARSSAWPPGPSSPANG
jgi:pSer/pThr/pTyr-binding forkhead associated (FHA) protein